MDVDALNRMLEARVKDLAHPKQDLPREIKQQRLLRALGLWPLPPRTALEPRTTGTIAREGYRVEKWVYDSRPGFPVTAHLYVPDGEGPFPLVLRPHGHFSGKKSEPTVQASAISFALYGYATLVVDSPGHSWDLNDQNERKGVGPHDDWHLAMGSPVIGVYAWDVVRGLDWLQDRSDIDSKRVAIVGESGGGAAALYAFAIDERIRSSILVVALGSMAIQPHFGCLCNHVPGVIQVGDRADVLSLRSPAPVFIIGAQNDPEFPPEGHQDSADRLRKFYKPLHAESNVRLEIFEGGHDYNRRMREASLAFLEQTLKDQPARPYLPEKRPITDGHLNSYPAQTVPFDDPMMTVLQPSERSTMTFRDLLKKGLQEPYPEEFHAVQRLSPWARFGNHSPVQPGETLVLVDGTAQSGFPDRALFLHQEQINQRLCHLLGLSIPEFLAQVLHLLIPGVPDGWDAIRNSSDPLTNVVASMKTLWKPKEEEVMVKKVDAHGPVASLTSRFLQLLRPELEVKATHTFDSWTALMDSGDRALVQPGARYLAWPFNR
jgi:dienelactone hydrolase